MANSHHLDGCSATQISSQVPRMSCTGPFKGGPGGAHFDDMQSFWGQGPCGSRSHLPPLRGQPPTGGLYVGEASGPHRRGDSCGPGSRQLLPRKVPPRRGRDPLGLIANTKGSLLWCRIWFSQRGKQNNKTPFGRCFLGWRCLFARNP